MPDDSKIKLKSFTDNLNNKKWIYSNHTLNNLRWRTYNIEDILLYIKNKKLNAEDIFEFYELNNQIIKVCYRFSYTKNMDLILILNGDKKIITIYLNNKNDKHITLKKDLYTKAVINV
jgi:hypothetical protein